MIRDDSDDTYDRCYKKYKILQGTKYYKVYNFTN